LPVQARRLDRLDHAFVDHDLQAAAFWANLAAQLRTFIPTMRRLTWLGERELRARRMRVRDPERGCWLPFLPDAYFEIVHADGRVQCGIVEVDMGTLTLRRFARKVHASEAALEDGVFRRRFKRDEFEVFVLTQSRRRLHALQKAAEPVVSGDHRGDYFFATLEALEPARFAEWEWLDLDDEACAGALWTPEIAPAELRVAASEASFVSRSILPLGSHVGFCGGSDGVEQGQARVVDRPRRKVEGVVRLGLCFGRVGRGDRGIELCRPLCQFSP
jgi:hypothetical protein